MKSAPLIAMSPAIPSFLSTTARAQVTNEKGRVLVVIELDGGNDGINTIVPFRDEGYAKNRKVLRLAKPDLIRVNEELAFHPSMRSAAELLEDGQLSVVQGVGYPNPNRSHEVSKEIWHTGDPTAGKAPKFGWIGRVTDQMPTPRDGSPNSILLGTEDPPLALSGRSSTSITMARLDDLQRTEGAETTPEQGLSANDDLLAFVQRTTLDAYATGDLLKDTLQKDSAARYPHFELADRLQKISQMIKSGFSTPVYYAIQTGYDTHFSQLPDHARLLNQLSRALKAFFDDLRAARIDDRVVVMCFSEFGRRVKENASLGTDHGTAGPVFLGGPSVKSGFVGDTPALTDLVDGDLRTNVDFRQIYSAVQREWLGVDGLGDNALNTKPLSLFRQA